MHQNTCNKNPRMNEYVAKRYGKSHITGSHLLKALSQRSLVAGLERPMVASTPAALDAICARAIAAPSTLAILSSQDIGRWLDRSYSNTTIVQTQASLVAGLERPMVASTPAALATIGACSIARLTTLPSLSSQDIARRLDMSGSPTTITQTQGSLVAGLERPMVASTPAALDTIGARAMAGQALP